MLALFLLNHSPLFQDLIPVSKFSLNLGLACHTILQPRMIYDIRNTKAFVWVAPQHHCKKILELLREVVRCFAPRMRAPKDLVPVTTNQIVILVFFFGIAERRVTRPHYEQDDSSSEKVASIRLIGLVRDDFRGHVSWRSFASPIEARPVAALDLASKAKVDNLDVEVRVEEHIFGLEVAMCESF